MGDSLAVYVLDSFALLAYLGGEPGAARIRSLLAESGHGRCNVYMSLVNLGEVLYIAERENGLVSAQQTLAAVEQLPIQVLPVTRQTVLAAAHVKAPYPVAYADAFAIVAAQHYRGAVVTGDPEFKAVAHVVNIEWLSRR